MKKIRVADYVASFIKKIGVDCVFMVPGGGAMFLNDAIQCKKGLDFVAFSECLNFTKTYFQVFFTKNIVPNNRSLVPLLQ